MWRNKVWIESHWMVRSNFTFGNSIFVRFFFFIPTKIFIAHATTELPWRGDCVENQNYPYTALNHCCIWITLSHNYNKRIYVMFICVYPHSFGFGFISIYYRQFLQYTDMNCLSILSIGLLAVYCGIRYNVIFYVLSFYLAPDEIATIWRIVYFFLCFCVH